jgi:hypothetical protein
MGKIILANDPTRHTNGRAIADLVVLGLIREDDLVLDLTVGPEAGFWTDHRPHFLTTNDLDPDVSADIHVDALISSWPVNGWDVVAWDAPYGYRGTSRLASDARYGIAGKYRTPDQIDRLVIDGTIAAMRMARRLVLSKCQDANVSSRFRDQSGFVTEAVRQAGGKVVGKLYINARRDQPDDKPQLNIWGYNSVMLLIAPGKNNG